MIKFALAAGIAAAAFFLPHAHASSDEPIESRVEYYTRLQALASQPEAASLAVVVVRRGEPVFMGVWGEADRDSGQRASQNTSYHLASVSKPFVAVAVMQLVEAGELALDDQVAEWLPELAPTGEGAETMTIRHLLQHTAGLPDVEDYNWASNDAREDAGERYLREISGVTLIGIPGEQSVYSNIGYDLLAVIIARASGQSFEDYMREHVLRPAGMQTASFLRTDISSEREATGHVLEDGRTAPVFPYNRRHAPSSTLQASAVDMVSLLGRITSRRNSMRPLLGDDSLAEMWSDETVEQDGQQMALGWFASPYRGRRRFSHTGGDIGFAAYLAVFPDDQVGIALMTNSPMAMPTQEILLTAVQGAYDLYID